jgi:hypothetical protein
LLLASVSTLFFLFFFFFFVGFRSLISSGIIPIPLSDT